MMFHVLILCLLLHYGLIPCSMSAANARVIGSPQDNASIAPESDEATSSVDQILKAISLKDRPYPSVEVGSSDQWDIMIIMELGLANKNFENMRSEPAASNQGMMRTLYHLDCDTPHKSWFYSTGSCFELTIEFAAPALSLDASGNVILTTNVDSGVANLMINTAPVNSTPIYTNHTSSLAGYSFQTDAEMNQVYLTEEENGTLIYVDVSNADVTIIVHAPSKSPVPTPVEITYMENYVTGQLRALDTNKRAYPFYLLSFQDGVSPILAPTETKLSVFKSKTDGKEMVATFIMTEDRPGPASTHVDDELAYLPDGMDFFMIISNRLLVKRVIGGSVPSDISLAYKTYQTSGGYDYYSLTDTTFRSGKSFSICKDSEESEWGSCGCTGDVTYDVNLGSISLPLNNQPKSHIDLENWYQEYTFGFCSLYGYPDSGKASVDYSKHIELAVNAGNLTFSTTTTNTNDIPSESFWLQNKFMVDEIQDVTSKIESVLQSVVVFEDFNIYKSESVTFSTFSGINLSKVSVMYDLYLLGTVQS
eukprot:Nk52_evm11s257 gene=Nk52_evmTU11s257